MITSAQEFLQLMRNDKEYDYQRFRHDEAPIEVWTELVEKYPLANEWIARNKTSPVQILRRIASDPRIVVRAEVAMTRRITEDIQMQLARDPDASVRNTLANNSKITDAVLDILLEDCEAFVRESAINQMNKRMGEQGAAANP